LAEGIVSPLRSALPAAEAASCPVRRSRLVLGFGFGAGAAAAWDWRSDSTGVVSGSFSAMIHLT